MFGKAFMELKGKLGQSLVNGLKCEPFFIARHYGN